MKRSTSQNGIGDFQHEEGAAQEIRVWIYRLISLWRWIIVSIALCAIIALLLNRYQTNLFLVKGSLLIDEDQKDMSSVLIEELDMFSNNINIENETAILKSYTLTRQVVDSLQLYCQLIQKGSIKSSERFGGESVDFIEIIQFEDPKKSSFELGVRNMDNGQVLISIGDSENVHNLGDTITFNNIRFILKSPVFKSNSSAHEDVKIIFHNREELTKQLQKEIHIAPLKKDASIIVLSLEAPNIDKSKEIIRALMDFYITRELTLKNETASKTIEFIDAQLEGIQNALFTAETQLENFRSSNKILDISHEGMTIYTRIQDLEKEASNTDLQLSYYDYLLNYLNKSDPFGNVVSPSTAGISDPSLNTLVLQLNELSSSQLILSESSATELNPQVKQLRAQIQAVLSAIRENVKNLHNTTSILKEDLKIQIVQAEKELNKLPSSERQLLNIQRRFNLNDDLYVYLQQKKAESGIAKASAVASTKIVDAPLMYEQTQPRKLLNFAIALFFGFLLPIVFFSAKDYLTHSVQDVADLEDNTDVPILGTIPLSNHNTELVMAEKPRSMVAESYRVLRSSLQYINSEKLQTIMVTSFGSGDGKTFNSINISTMFAKAGKKTVLLGIDMRRPKIFDTFGVSNDLGMSNLLIETHSIDEVIHETNVENLSFISSGPIPPNPNELILRPTFESVMVELKKRFDCIIIDSPPIGLVSDGLEMVKYVDSVLFIVRHQKTTKSVAHYINDLTNKGIVSNMSLIYNGLNVKAGYGKYDYQYYSEL